MGVGESIVLPPEDERGLRLSGIVIFKCEGTYFNPNEGSIESVAVSEARILQRS